MSEMRPLLVDAATRAMAGAGEDYSDALWRAIEAAGLPGAMLAEQKGGSGADWGDAMAILRVAGKLALPAPLAESMLAQSLLSECGLSVPAGPLTVAPVERDTVTLARTRNGWRLEGRARFVPWARVAGWIATLALHEDGRPFVALVPRSDIGIEPAANLADEPRDTITFATDVPADAAAPAAMGLQGRGAMARAAMMAGALEAVLELTVRYAGERQQFGRAIAKFQAIQQQIAELAGHVAAAGVAADAAAAAPEDGFMLAVAKARVSEACGPVAAIAHQVHGAMGFAREHRLNLYTRRLWSWRDEFGDEAYWWGVLGRAAAQAGSAGLWPLVTDRPQ
ncbi:MAG: acyl-CoA dehydrogenase family protein [Stellaceae bacterium]